MISSGVRQLFMTLQLWAKFKIVLTKMKKPREINLLFKKVRHSVVLLNKKPVHYLLNFHYSRFDVKEKKKCATITQNDNQITYRFYFCFEIRGNNRRYLRRYLIKWLERSLCYNAWCLADRNYDVTPKSSKKKKKSFFRIALFFLLHEPSKRRQEFYV